MPSITRIDPEPFFSLPHRTSGPAGAPLHNRLPFYRAYATGLPSHVKSLVLTSDLQGREAGSQNRLLGVPVAEALVGLSRNGVIPVPDAVFLCGDLFDYPDCRKRGGTGPVDEVFQAFSEVTPEVVGVLGNHDQMDHPEALPDNTTLLDGGVVRVLGNLNVGGVSGIVGNPNRNQRRTEDDFLTALESVTDQAPDILLLHQGPTDPERANRRGDPGVALSLETGFQGLTVFGHTRWGWPWLISLGEGQALNVDGRGVVVLPEVDGV
ncbi:metallophosphoesterase family protein [Marinobacter nauticus]|uniref:metallophosphoesterase family protein n=1 Tax=Marinobacter nauticus TaxID=2743 RepID=UPI001C94697A|nr:metallophosphoesterase [Marinobacter nauticus]MBY6102444.1 metallophosphoesterase [Marinobacter nauticus]